jgi:hypothetical protein
MAEQRDSYTQIRAELKREMDLSPDRKAFWVGRGWSLAERQAAARRLQEEDGLHAETLDREDYSCGGHLRCVYVRRDEKPASSGCSSQ